MAYSVVRGAAVRADLVDISVHVARAALSFGHAPDEAMAMARRRLEQIETAMTALARAPHQGTLMPHLMPGLRAVTKDRAIFYFTLDEAAETVQVLAIFHGGQDHHARMLRRLARG